MKRLLAIRLPTGKPVMLSTTAIVFLSLFPLYYYPAPSLFPFQYGTGTPSFIRPSLYVSSSSSSSPSPPSLPLPPSPRQPSLILLSTSPSPPPPQQSPAQVLLSSLLPPPPPRQHFPPLALSSPPPLRQSPLLVLTSSPSASPPPSSPPPPPSYPPPLPQPLHPDHSEPRKQAAQECNLFKGRWVPNGEAPYYTNTTCWMIQEHQNCMKYGRPDTEFLKWRWKPDDCELPVFDPARFLKLVRGKAMAFVGDSLARNQMQSLMCLLSKVEYPKDISSTSDENFKRMYYRTYDFTIFIFWSPFLVRTEGPDREGPLGLWKLHLDEVDKRWMAHMKRFDYLIISGGNWFTRPSMYYRRRKLVGCNYCQSNKVPMLSLYTAHRRAFHTALRAIIRSKGYKGLTFLRTVSPQHFENGKWNEGGDCPRTRPHQRNEARMDGMDLRHYKDQLHEFREADKVGRRQNLRFKLLDTTQAMVMRPDGHPSRYGHWPQANETMYNDCVHWCLPGPIDMWNDMLLQMLNE